jgi:deoxyxylulose-5-phosphate synthase
MFFIRYPRGKVVDLRLLDNKEVKIGQWDFVQFKNEAKLTIIVTGPMTHQVIEAFKNSNINIVYARFYHPIDNDLLSKLKGKIIIYDIYSTNLGLFSSVASYYNQNHAEISLIDFSLKNIYYPHGNTNDLLKRYKLDLESLTAEVNTR